MAKSVVFHIGDTKTGSTSIQHTMHSRSWTCPTVSVDYPPQLSSGPVANSMKEGNDHKDFKAFRGLADWLSASEADTAVISSEKFSAVDPGLLNFAISAHMPEHAGKARIVAYVRPHAPRFVSIFMQRAKTGGVFEDLKSFFQRSKHHGLMLYAERFRSWKAVFGDNFFLRPMVREELQAGDVVSDFLNVALNGADFQLRPLPRSNESLTVEALSGVRKLQTILQKGEIDPGTRHSVGNALGKLISERPAHDGTKLRMNIKIYRKMVRTYREDAEALDREFFTTNPMVRALEAAEADATKEDLAIDASLYLSKDDLADLQDASQALVSLFKAEPKTWRVANALELDGETAEANSGKRKQEKEAHVAEVKARLEQAAATICRAQPAPKAPEAKAKPQRRKRRQAES